MAGLYFGQGTSASWAGMRLSELLTYEWSGAKGEAYEVTNRGSRVIGVGAQSRVIKEYDTLSIEPLRITLTFYGAPPNQGHLQELAGATALLTFQTPPNQSVSGLATLDDWTWGCDGVATLQRGSMTFTLGTY